MSAIRTKVTITNALDDMRARRGEIPAEQVRSYETDAVVDAEAVRSVIPAVLRERLGLSERGQCIVKSAIGTRGTVGVTGPIVFDILGRDTIEEALVFGSEILIGRTVIDKLDLKVDCSMSRLIPNPVHPDQPVCKVK